MTDKEAIKSLKWKVEYAKEIGEHHVDGVYVDALALAVKSLEDGKQRKQREWIPITMRPIEEDEKIDFPDATFMFDCPMPENGEEILITSKYGVEFDTCYNDDGYYLDSDRSWDEVLAWMPLPEAYKKGGEV